MTTKQCRLRFFSLYKFLSLYEKSTQFSSHLIYINVTIELVIVHNNFVKCRVNLFTEVKKDVNF